MPAAQQRLIKETPGHLRNHKSEHNAGQPSEELFRRGRVRKVDAKYAAGCFHEGEMEQICTVGEYTQLCQAPAGEHVVYGPMWFDNGN